MNSSSSWAWCHQLRMALKYDQSTKTMEQYNSCENPNKVSLCIGTYRDEDGKPYILPSVREAEKKLLDEEEGVNKDYPIKVPGRYDLDRFLLAAIEFGYGKTVEHGGVVDIDSIAIMQTIGGTGALSLAGNFLSKFAPVKKIYLSNPTWKNHVDIFETSGLEVDYYRYYDSVNNSLDFTGMVQDLKEAPVGSIVLFQLCGHNPTGCDPCTKQWRELSNLCKERKLQVIFDSAYQGLASGDTDADAYALRMFVHEGHKVIVAQSFSKNFGIYGERCGALSLVIDKDVVSKETVLSNLTKLVLPIYGWPSIHGAAIVKVMLRSYFLTNHWY